MKKSLLALFVGVTLLCVFLLARKPPQVGETRAGAGLPDPNPGASTFPAEGHPRQPLQDTLQTEPVKLVARDSAPETLAAPGASGGRELSAIFRDPAMQETMKDEARREAARNIKALFDSGLVRQLNLNEEQTTALRELLLQKASLFWERMLLPMMTGELDEAGMVAAGRLLRQNFDENTAQVKALLGGDGYQVYQWYEKTEADRDHARQFIPEFEQAGQALSDKQQAELVGIMTEERANFRFSLDLGDPAQLDLQHWYDNFTNEKIETFASELQQLNDRVVERAKNVLTADQATLLQSQLNRQVQKGRLTMLTTTAAIGKPR